MAIAPLFPRIGAGFATALLHRALISAARGMRLNLVWLAPDNVNAAAIGFPARDARRKVFVGIGQAAVVFLFGCIDRRLRVGIALVPKNLDELLALLVRGEFQECFALVRRNDVHNLVCQPYSVWRAELFIELLLAPLELF